MAVGPGPSRFTFSRCAATLSASVIPTAAIRSLCCHMTPLG